MNKRIHGPFLQKFNHANSELLQYDDGSKKYSFECMREGRRKGKSIEGSVDPGNGGVFCPDKDSFILERAR